MIVAVDFDGTVVTHEYPKIGRDTGATLWLRTLVEGGARLILYTMRSGKKLQEAKAWFKEHGIELWACNENPEQKDWTSSPKVYANVYVDDAAIGTPLKDGLKGERPFVDWDKVGPMLLDKLNEKPEAIVED